MQISAHVENFRSHFIIAPDQTCQIGRFKTSNISTTDPKLYYLVKIRTNSRQQHLNVAVEGVNLEKVLLWILLNKCGKCTRFTLQRPLQDRSDKLEERK